MTAASFVSVARSFASRTSLRAKVLLEFRADGRPRILCDQPTIVARFVSEVRQHAARWCNASVLLRGQTSDHERMLPSLFRTTIAPTQTLLRAERHLERALRRAFPSNKRFHRPHLSALLQHYGIKTHWLYVVDDLRTAIWFATHHISGVQALPRSGGSGWIYLIATQTSAATLKAVDLRLAHHGLSLRPQVQQAWSVCAQRRELDDWVIATVEFPITSAWTSTGSLDQAMFLFPDRSLDDTLKRLASMRVTSCLRSTERRYGLLHGTLGDVSLIK